MDANIYLDFWIRDKHQEKLDWASRRYLIRQSAVVLHELRRGAKTKKTIVFIEDLARHCPRIYAPLYDDWRIASEILAKLRQKFHWNKEQLTSFQNDTLIACTCRRNGLTLITANKKDFGLLQQYVDFSAIFW